jgi:predicted CXXCH cytochrome family protein
LSTLTDVYADTFAFVQYHVFDPYSVPWAVDRRDFYDAIYTPTAMFDGVDKVVGATSDSDQQYTIYRTNHFLPQRAIFTDVTMQVSGESLGGQDYRISAEVAIEPGGAGKTMRIYIVQVLDHWPADPSYSRNTFKQAAPTQDVTLAPGESQIVQTDLTFDADSWANQENIRIIAWAQSPTDQAPAEVYQAAVRDWPLESYPGDIDGDGHTDAVDNCPLRYNPGQADADGDSVGDDCDNCDDTANSDQLDDDEDAFGDVCDNCPVLHHVGQEDADGDVVGDACDSCPEVPAPGGVDSFGKSLGTIDWDCDVDLSDYATLALCYAGATVTTPPPGCSTEEFARCDVDADGDVDLSDFATFAENYTGPLTSPPNYVGQASCQSCHPNRHSMWTQTIHATAFATLVAAGEGDNELCYPCHAVGYGQPSGFVDANVTPHLANVQCENCHGPGSNHVADSLGSHLNVDMSGDMCGACHQSCHGLCGEDHHPQYEQWSTSMHSFALMNIQWEPDFADECLQCHSTDYRLAPAGNKPTIDTAVFDIECVACHNPHGGPNAAQLRQPAYLLCADCHTTQGAVPGEEPAQPQTEMLHSTGGYALAGAMMNGPYTEHWWGIPRECAACHVYKQAYGGPDQPVDSGHTFMANMKACEPCHSEAAATALVAVARDEIEARLNMIARYFDPGDPLYVDPATLSPEELDQYEIARFDYEFVLADKSYGSHNANYARALLAEAEAFFGIAPWLLQDAPNGLRFRGDLRTDGAIGRAEVR